MELTPNFKTTWATIKKPVRNFGLLLFVGVPLIKLFSLDELLLDTLLAKNLSSSGVLEPMLSNYPAFAILLVVIFFALIMSKVLLKFFEAIKKPRLVYNDVNGLKYTDIPPIPNKKSVLDYKKRVDAAYSKGLNRISPHVLSQHGVDENGRLR